MIPNEVKEVIRYFLDLLGLNSKTIIFLLAMVFLGVFSWIFFPKDNPIEEYAESQIQLKTGVKIDFSP